METLNWKWESLDSRWTIEVQMIIPCLLVGWELIWTKLKWKHNFSLKISYFHFLSSSSPMAHCSACSFISGGYCCIAIRAKSQSWSLGLECAAAARDAGVQIDLPWPGSKSLAPSIKHHYSHIKKPIKCFHILSKKFLDQVLIDIPISPTNIISCKTHALHLFATKNCTNLRRVKSIWNSQFNCRPPSA